MRSRWASETLQTRPPPIGLNFINVLGKAFTPVDPKSVKRQ